MPQEATPDQSFIIRKAREDDLPVLVGFLAKLDLHVSGEPPQNLKDKEFARLLDALRAALGARNKRLVVAEDPEAGLVGMGYVYAWRSQGIWEQSEPEEHRSGVIDDVWVEPEFRGRGVFRALIQELVAFAESRHVYELILEYSASNPEAKAVWTKLGFKVTGVRAAAFIPEVKKALAQW
ncbi:MAG: GNAT family N-acetyltransferase [Xanthomonadales bacterium]|nr:GNAT family N-acetyltransferase [Xanthomonadales bacterium]